MNTCIVFPACNATGWTSSFLSREGYAEPNTQYKQTGQESASEYVEN